MRRAFKYRLYPNANQERELGIMLETHRRLWNACLNQRKIAYDEDRISLGYCHQAGWFTNEKLVNPWFCRINHSSAQATMRRLDKAFAAFFRRIKAGEKAGYPRFKARGRFESVEFPSYGDGIRLAGDRLRVQNVGVIKAKVHRASEGEVKTASLRLEGEKWFVVLSCDLGDARIAKSQKPAAGIDLGIESFLTTSDDEHVANPRFQKRELPRLRVLGRAVSRKTKGGANRRKAVVRLSSCHARIRNLRHQHRHAIALSLVRRYGVIVAERLTVKNMVKNRRLARAIADAGWSGFIGVLKAKAESAGVEVIEVSPAYTSQTCSQCGSVVRKSLSERWHHCECGCSLHRDHNAALNILQRGLARTGPVELNVGVG